WFDWGLLCALAIAIWYLVVAIRKPDTAIGYFLLPMVLALIALTELVRDAAPFSRDDAAGGWSMLHGLAMTVGCAAVLIGFVAGVMFLLQSHRLKNKRAGSTRIKLPTLEWLQTLNRRCLMVSTVAVAIGFVAGIVMNLNRWGYVPWSNQGVLLSGVLMLWLLGASVTEFVYAPASRGRKIAYLTLASLGFLVLTVFGVVMGGHGE
ncbi:MAG: cytochrome c biogenesis protein CcsA, partial [Planctomycetota bacterium]